MRYYHPLDLAKVLTEGSSNHERVKKLTIHATVLIAAMTDSWLRLTLTNSQKSQPKFTPTVDNMAWEDGNKTQSFDSIERWTGKYLAIHIQDIVDEQEGG